MICHTVTQLYLQIDDDVQHLYFPQDHIKDTDVNRSVLAYRKVPKFSDARKLCCSLPKIQVKRPNLRVFRQKDANGLANSKDPDQTAPLGLHCLPGPDLVCPDLSVRKLWIIMVH